MNINKDIEDKLKKLFPFEWKNIILKYHNQLRKIDQLNIKDDRKNIIKKNVFVGIIKRIDKEEKRIQYEKDILEKIIPKDKLKDRTTYIGTGCELSRGIKEATWNEKEQIFYYVRYKHGKNILDKIEHFADVINTTFAGFTPLKEKEKGKFKQEDYE